jgi:hypothetical protein
MESMNSQRNREVACTIGDLVTALYDEIEVLPLSDRAKQTLVMVMVSDIMRREGCVINFYLPARSRVEVAA